jgi:hypothetical protein
LPPSLTRFSRLRRSIALALGAALFLAGCSARKDDGPETAVRAFAAAIGQADARAAARHVSGGLANGRADAVSEFLKQSPVEIVLSEVKSAQSGETAAVTAVVAIRPKGSAAPGPAPAPGSSPEPGVVETVALRQEGGTWKIVPPPPGSAPPGEPGPLITMARMIAAGSPGPAAMARTQDTVRRSTCTANLKQVAAALRMFLQDYRDTFDLRAEELKSKLQVYSKSEMVFRCPEDAPEAPGYAFNPALEGLQQSAVRSPELTVMVYEGAGGVLDFRHDGKAAVGFVNGEVKLVDQTEAAGLMWQP